MKMTVYACGGCGVNLLTPFVKNLGKAEPGFAEIHPVFIDTSRSNLTGNYPEDNLFLIDGLDGSGKKRDANYKIINEKAPEVLHRFKPTPFNVVIHSTSGGSGSVIGSVLTSALLARGENVVVMMVGSSDSRIEAQNTINTLKSYEVISNKRKKPVVAIYYENTKDTPRGKVDASMHMSLVLLSVLFSGQNRELDSADLSNFLDYPKVTSFPPMLSYLDFFTDISVTKGQSVVSLATLTDNETSSEPNVAVEYQAVGFVTPEVKDAISVGLPIHAAVVAGYYNDRIQKLESRVASIDEARAVVNHRSIVDHDVSATEDGLIL